MTGNTPYYLKQHEDAVARGQLFYMDAMSGYQVWTALYLTQRGYCCQSGCRHCPYGFKDKNKQD